MPIRPAHYRESSSGNISGLTHGQVDERITAIVEAWARISNNGHIPVEKLPENIKQPVIDALTALDATQLTAIKTALDIITLETTVQSLQTTVDGLPSTPLATR